MELTWGNRVGGSVVKCAGHSTLRRDDESLVRELEVLEAMPPRKASREEARARTKTDTGGQVENTKVIEITLVKELGKMAP